VHALEGGLQGRWVGVVDFAGRYAEGVQPFWGWGGGAGEDEGGVGWVDVEGGDYGAAEAGGRAACDGDEDHFDGCLGA
jgi:hypothetical protein